VSLHNGRFCLEVSLWESVEKDIGQSQ
jgi:hypothetical protein